MSLSAHLSIPAPRRSPDDHGVARGDRPSPEAQTPAGALSLLVQARGHLLDAKQASRPADRYVCAHLAALRAATAVVVARAWSLEHAKPTSVWRLLADSAPELRDWADFYAARSDRRAAAEAGIPGVTGQDADQLLRRSGEFLDIVGRSLLGAGL
ncbi:SAV_6107 family HEPN domain-containing protein [Saccharopolyspora taberi]|uniref:SAV-6107-like HEPN domain-containing protein n=1 Tax=Saccharopolyspora taberi TaxID=60895 RepID=A0ABN3VGY8_9PSEU